MLICEIYAKNSHINIKCFPTQYLQYFVALGAFYIAIRNHVLGAQVALGGQHGPKIPSRGPKTLQNPIFHQFFSNFVMIFGAFFDMYLFI